MFKKTLYYQAKVVLTMLHFSNLQGQGGGVKKVETHGKVHSFQSIGTLTGTVQK